MLETLDARLAQARAGDLGHIEFLQALCHDEISRRDSPASPAGSAAPASSKQPPSKTSTSPTTRSSPPPRSATSPPCACLTAGESVILHGPVGVGKTPRSPKPSATTPAAKAHDAGSPRPAAPRRPRRRTRRPQLGPLAWPLGPTRRAHPRRLRDPRTHRHPSRRSLRTRHRTRRPAASCSPPTVARDWYPLFPNPVVAESLLDRLINTAHHIHMNGPSYRPNNRPKPTQEPP